MPSGETTEAAIDADLKARLGFMGWLPFAAQSALVLVVVPTAILGLAIALSSQTNSLSLMIAGVFAGIYAFGALATVLNQRQHQIHVRRILALTKPEVAGLNLEG